MPSVRKLVVWDIDGPINHGFSQSKNDYYLPPFRSEYSKRGADPFDFVVSNKPFLKITLDVLYQNKIESVIGSQRIQMEESDPQYGRFISAMYQGLDHVFGKKRAYLKEDNAREIGLSIQNEQTNYSKNSIIKAYQDKFNVAGKDIIFIDDHINYKAATEEAGHVFVHAPRKAQSSSIDDNAYLYETLLRAVPVHEIYRAIENSDGKGSEKNAFKKQLCIYQLEHLQDITSWQEKLLDRPRLNTHMNPELNSKDLAARQVLKGIQGIILDSKWDIGYFGGVNVVDLTTGVKNTIPKGMNDILIEIKLAQIGSKKWSEALSKIDEIVQESSERKDHWFFNKRGETTQVFYDTTKKILSELRENRDHENDEDSKPKI